MQGFAIVRLLLSHYKQNLCSWIEEFGPQSTLGNQADRQDLMRNLKSFIQRLYRGLHFIDIADQLPNYGFFPTFFLKLSYNSDMIRIA